LNFDCFISVSLKVTDYLFLEEVQGLRSLFLVMPSSTRGSLVISIPRAVLSSSHWHLGRKAAGIDAEINEWVDDDSADERADDDYHFKLRAPILEVPFKTAVKYTVRNL
jgi:hypothetical protein